MSKYYVATSIPYVNGEPHLGHAMEFVMADVLARQARQNGDDVIFSTGSDEHGGKIAEKAAELGLEPKALADKMSARFSALAKSFEYQQRSLYSHDRSRPRTTGQAYLESPR